MRRLGNPVFLSFGNTSQRGFPRGVEVVSSAIIRNAEGKVLLTRSPKWGNKWVLPGGHVDPGESVLEAAQREAEEETGLTVKPVGMVAIGELINPRDFYRRAHFLYFDCVFDVVGGALRLQSREITEARWVSLRTARQMDLGESYPQTLRAYGVFLRQNRSG